MKPIPRKTRVENAMIAQTAKYQSEARGEIPRSACWPTRELVLRASFAIVRLLFAARFSVSNANWREALSEALLIEYAKVYGRKYFDATHY